MAVLAEFSALLEVYSIDEAFLDLSYQQIDDLTEFGRYLQSQARPAVPPLVVVDN